MQLKDKAFSSQYSIIYVIKYRDKKPHQTLLSKCLIAWFALWGNKEPLGTSRETKYVVINSIC